MGKKSDVATDVLGDAITVLEALKDASDAISAVPCLGAVFAGALGLLKTIQMVNTSNGNCNRLALRTKELAQYIEQRVAQNIDGVEADLITNLNQLSVLLETVRTDVARLKKRKYIIKLLQTSSIAGRLNEHTEALNSAWRSFDTCCLLSIDRKLKEHNELYQNQIIYDKDQYRIFRDSEFKLIDEYDDFHPRDGYPRGAKLALWKNRLVILRTLRNNDSGRVKPDAAVACRRRPRLNHSRIVRVLGYSHPVLREPYYVMETKGVPLLQYLNNIKDTQTVLQIWLQTLLDHKSARDYLKTMIPILTDMSTSKDSYFATVRVDESSRSLFSVEDVTHEEGELFRFWQFHYHSRLELNGANYLSGNRGPIPYQTCLSTLQNDKYRSYADHPRRSRDKTDSPRTFSASVQLGDYGYFTSDGRSIYLGNILDIISDLNGGPMDKSDIWEDAIGTFPRSPTQLTEKCFSDLRFAPDIGSQWGRALCFKWVRLSDRSLKLFWDHAVHLAAEHEIALHDIVIAESWTRLAEVKWYRRKCKGCHGREWRCRKCHGETLPTVDSNRAEHWVDPSLGGEFEFSVKEHVQDTSVDAAPFSLNLYFHFVPSSDSKYEHRSLTPWAYWSLDPEPCPGPWPDIASGNFHVRQAHRSEIWWQYLPPLEAALSTYTHGYKLPQCLPFYTARQYNPWRRPCPDNICDICNYTYTD